MVDLTAQDVALRLALALAAGLVIGMERESHGRAAGLRTTVLVCVAAAIAMILSSAVFSATGQDGGGWRPDPARLAAGILTGMGFLGAGVIMREGRIVRGVTTAASLWFTTILGLTIGAGHYALAIAGLSIALLVLFVLPVVEHFIRNDWYGSIRIVLARDAMPDSQLKARIEAMGITIKDVELDYDLTRNRRTFVCRIKFKKGDVFSLSEKVVQDLAGCPGVLFVKWT